MGFAHLGRFVIHWTVCEKLEEDEDSPQGAAIDVQVRGGEGGRGGEEDEEDEEDEEERRKGEERRRGERTRRKERRTRRTRTHVEERRGGEERRRRRGERRREEETRGEWPASCKLSCRRPAVGDGLTGAVS